MKRTWIETDRLTSKLAMEMQNETILSKERPHWGIFIPVSVAAGAAVLATLPVLFFVNAMTHIVNQLGPQTAHSYAWVFILVALPEFGIGAVLLMVTWFAYRKSEITLTNRRLIFRTGFLSRLSGELPLENVESIFIFEPLFGRLCGYGTVSVTSIGGKTFPLRFIGSPHGLHAMLQKAVGDAKVQGKHVSRPPEPPPNDDSRYMPKL